MDDNDNDFGAALSNIHAVVAEEAVRIVAGHYKARMGDASPEVVEAFMAHNWDRMKGEIAQVAIRAHAALMRTARARVPQG